MICARNNKKKFVKNKNKDMRTKQSGKFTMYQQLALIS